MVTRRVDERREEELTTLKLIVDVVGGSALDSFGCDRRGQGADACEWKRERIGNEQDGTGGKRPAGTSNQRAFHPR